MKTKKLLLGTFLLLSAATFAQSPEQRAAIKKDINVAELQRLEAKFRLEFENDEQKVLKFLRENPTVQRSETKNGSLHYIKSIDDNGQPVYINTKSNIASGVLIKANSLYSGGSIGANITGTGMLVGVWDGGQIRTTHELLSGRVTMHPNQALNTTAGNNHMNHCTGTIVGKDIGNTARGIAYNASARCYDWSNDEAEMTGFAGEGFLISNHSYGYLNLPTQAQWSFGAYDVNSKDWDELLKNTPNYLPFVAGGNEQTSNGSGKTGVLQGYDVITGTSAAKNVVTVGAVNADRSMSEYSNFGPTDDGRIKPDICARGTGINSAQYTNDTAYSGDGSDSSGTSYATPAVAAAALLLQQYHFSLNNNYMTAAMLKCLLLHSADDAGAVGPDMKFGWGIANIERAAQIIKDAKFTGKARMHTFTTNPTNDATSELTISGTGTSTLTPGLDTGEVKASMCWTDNEGIEQTIANGVDPTMSRLAYNFDFMFSRTTPLLSGRPYKQFTMAALTANAEYGTAWWQNNVDNYRQTSIAAGATVGASYSLNLRKSVASPVVARNVATIITGLAQTSALSTNDLNSNNATVFYSQADSKIKLISNTVAAFGKYSIFDITGKNIQSGNIKANEIEFATPSTGVYIINFENEGKINKLKFVVQ